MIVLESSTELKKLIKSLKKDGKSIGFTPTMGALHEGHMALIQSSGKMADISVCSIFVNPTQFNEASDLDNYPRTLEADKDLLEKNGCDILIFPAVEEVYPPDQDNQLSLDFKGIDEGMEGKFRPGHFAGVAQVVDKFLQMVTPDFLFMGQKDFQQVAIVRFMMNELGHKCQLIMSPTVRHADGLAQSSRNMRLEPHIKSQANVIYRTLSWAKEQVGIRPITEVQEVAMANLSIPNFRPEYFEIIDGYTLKPITTWTESQFIVACTAVWGGEVRLIDNMILRKTGE